MVYWITGHCQLVDLGFGVLTGLVASRGIERASLAYRVKGLKNRMLFNTGGGGGGGTDGLEITMRHHRPRVFGQGSGFNEADGGKVFFNTAPSAGSYVCTHGAMRIITLPSKKEISQETRTQGQLELKVIDIISLCHRLVLQNATWEVHKGS